MTEKRSIPCCPICGSVNYIVRVRSHDHKCYSCCNIFKKCATKEIKVRKASPKVRKTELVIL